MHKKIKQITPEILIKAYQRLKIKIFYFQIKKIIIKNEKIFKKRKAVVIIANGPSISKIDFNDLIIKMDSIVMNSFYKHPLAEKLKIVAYCVGELGADVSSFDISKVLAIKSQSYWFSSDFIPRLTTLCEKVHIYMPGDDSQLSIRKQKINLSKPSPNYETTAQMAIIIAIAMGYKNIYLIGYDHNFLACGQYLDHFYKEDSETPPSNMFVNSSDYQSLIQNCDRMWSRYKKIDLYAKKNDINILNCGENSYLDVFRRSRLEKLIKKS